MDLNLRTETFAGDDQTWLASQHGTDAAQSITLDVSEFVEGTHYPEGFIPGGTPVAIVDGVAVPYDDEAEGDEDILAGFILDPTRVRGNGDVSAPLLVHGFINLDRLPFDVDPDAEGFETTGLFVFFGGGS